MIGDVTSQPEPLQINLVSPDPALLEAWAPRGAAAIAKIDGVVDVLDGIENTISGPATTFQINPSVAARAGFTPEEIATDAAAILGGEPAAAPVISADRPYTVRVRFPAGNRASLEAIRDTLLRSGTGKTATLGALATLTELPPQTQIPRENFKRDRPGPVALERPDLGRAVPAVPIPVAALPIHPCPPRTHGRPNRQV